MKELDERHGYFGEAIDPNWTPNSEPVAPVIAPTPDGMEAMPPPGIYFGMPEDRYHRVHALSSSGIKKMIASTMEYWAYGRMNPDYEEPVSKFFNHGKATHKLVLEGEASYLAHYFVTLDPADFDSDDIIMSTDGVKNAIRQCKVMAPVSPTGTKAQELRDQLDALGEKHGQKVDLDGTVADLKKRIKEFEEEQPVAPISRVALEVGTRAATKDDWIEQLLKLDPEAKVWDHMVSCHFASHQGKVAIEPKDDRRVRIAAHMISQHPDGGGLFSGGYSEVSIFWHCHITGVPMKARVDYLKLRALIDLKTFSNQQGKPVNKAIEHSIANYRYNVQHAFYDQAVLMGRKLVAELGPDCIYPSSEELADAQTDFCERWCAAEGPPVFVFVFQQSGIAPVTRVRKMPREEIFKGSMRLIENIAFKWRECAETYGTDPWIDVEPMDQIDDEAIPMWAIETGGFYD